MRRQKKAPHEVPIQYHTRLLLQCMASFPLGMLSGNECRAWFGKQRVRHFCSCSSSELLSRLDELLAMLCVDKRKLVLPRNIRRMRVSALDLRIRLEAEQAYQKYTKQLARQKPKGKPCTYPE